MRTRFSRLIVFALATFALLVGAARANAADVDYQPWSALLKAHVNEPGMIDYAAIKEAPANLNAFLADLRALDDEALKVMKDKDRLALYLNAYNAFVISAVVEHYPLDETFSPPTKPNFPEDSIHQIPNVWKAEAHRLGDRNISLDALEHEVVRKEFAEPRIHFALVCGAVGCPKLQRFVYEGDKLDEQLDKAFTDFNETHGKIIIQEAQDLVLLHSIYEWFGSDFAPLAKESIPSVFDEGTVGVLNMIGETLSRKERKYLFGSDYSVQYTPYDWSLNDQ